MANQETPSRLTRRSQQTGKPKKTGGSKKPKKSPKTPISKIILRVFVSLFVLGCFAFLGGVGLFWFYAKDAPKITDDQLDASASSTLYAGDTAIADLGAERREKITAQEIPQLLEDAIVSVEDKRFYKHVGVDPIRIVGSALSNVRNGGMQGGSTLTQQLIKLSFFSTKASDQTLKRKAQEAWMAVQLEKEKSKEEILTYYINKVYMSNGLSGMETASEAYFGKTLSELNLAQTALLAGMPQAPESYDPYRHPEAAKKRRNIVLQTMLENEKITQKEYDDAIKTDIASGLIDFQRESQSWAKYDGYVKEVIQQVKDLTGKDVYTDGLKVYTNLDLEAQDRLYEIVNSDDYVQYPDEDMQVAATVMNTDNGKVIAQIGGRNIASDVVLGTNLAVNTARDFGSTMKPLTDYGPAFEYLKNSTADRIVDEPYQYPGTDIEVRNWDGQYFGDISLRTALAYSRNVPAVKTLDEVGLDQSKKFLSGLGIDYQSMEYSNAISSNTIQEGTKYGASSEKMAAAYSAFANGGTYYKPMYISKIVYQDGSVEEFQSEGKRAMSPGTAYIITDILKGVISEATGTNAQIPGLIQAGKTGTSNYTDDQLEKLGTTSGVYPDILFSGYTPDYAMAVWTGYNNIMTPVTNQSNLVASSVYRELMSYITSNIDVSDWDMPDDLVRYGGELYFKDTYVAPTPSVSVTPSSSSTSEASSTTTESTTESSTTESSTASSTKESESTSSSSEASKSSEESKAPESSTAPSKSSEPSQSSESQETAPSTSETTPEESAPAPSDSSSQAPEEKADAADKNSKNETDSIKSAA